MDLIRWRRWASRKKELLTGLEFLYILSKYRFINIYGPQFIDSVREQGLLLASEDTEALIEELAITIEREQKSLQTRKKKRLQLLFELHLIELVKLVSVGLPKEDIRDMNYHKMRRNELNNLDTSELTDFERWYKDYTKYNLFKLTRWKPELIDAIYKLLEQLRAKRRDMV